MTRRKFSKNIGNFFVNCLTFFDLLFTIGSTHDSSTSIKDLIDTDKLFEGMMISIVSLCMLEN